jgi:hypothetical protein
MKKVAGVFAILLLAASIGKAQNEPKEKPKRIVIPVRVQIQLTELEGDKKIAVLPYSFLAQAEKKDFPSFDNALRVGVRFPSPDKDGKPSYIDIGSNVDCGVAAKDDGLFEVRLNYERSSLYANKKGQDGVSIPDTTQPIVPTMRTASIVLVKDGQTAQIVSAADPLNGHIFRIDVTLTVQK